MAHPEILDQAMLYLAAMALMTAFAALALCISRRWREATAGALQRDQSNLDGLRGLLAMSVLLHHGACNLTLIRDGYWDAGGAFRWNIGNFAVGYFFMITGMLFWRKACAGLDARAHFASRFRRIAPAFYLHAAIVLVICLVWMPANALADPGRLLADITRMALAGFAGSFPVNGIDHSLYLDGVWWTLAYEWQFYIALPLIAFFAVTSAWRKLALLALVLLYGQFIDPKGPLLVLFAMGAIAIELAGWTAVRRIMSGKPAAAGTLAVLFYAMLVVAPGYGLSTTLWLFPAFLAVACGNTFFGILTARPLAAVGLVSYSLYLLHMPLIYFGIRLVNAFTPVGALAPGLYWALVSVIGCGAIVVAALSYFALERRFMHKKRSPLDDPAKNGAAERLRHPDGHIGARRSQGPAGRDLAVE